MAKVFKFDPQSPFAKKVKSETMQLRGKVIEFPRQKLNVENEEIEETNETPPLLCSSDVFDSQICAHSIRDYEGFQMAITRDRGGPSIELEHSLPSEVAAISPFVDRLMLLLRKCGCVAEGESDVEIALREALANAIIHGNLENPRKHVHIRCRCKRDEVSIEVKDEGRGFDINKVPNPTSPPNIGSIHGRGIYLMKRLMDEVRFDEGGVVVYMRKSVQAGTGNLCR